jgi:hypothetical protein
MTVWESGNAETSEWYTPKWLLDAIGLEYNLDPCSPGAGHWVPARRIFTKADNGLAQNWGTGLVFVNPPWGDHRGAVVPWLEKFLDHGNGIMIVRAYTSSGWWYRHVWRADGILFPRGKTQFLRSDGSAGQVPGHGIALLSKGPTCTAALEHSGLGLFVPKMVLSTKKGPIAGAIAKSTKDHASA